MGLIERKYLIRRCPGCGCQVHEQTVAHANYCPNRQAEPEAVEVTWPDAQLRGAVEDAAKWEALARRLYALMGEDAERLLPGDVESSELLRDGGSR